EDAVYPCPYFTRNHEEQRPIRRIQKTFIRYFEADFPTIVYNDALTSNENVSPNQLDQRHPFLMFEGLEYTDANIVDFEGMLKKIYGRGVHRVDVFDFGGLTTEMAEGLTSRMLMHHKYTQRQSVFTSREIKSAGFGAYWDESARRILDKGNLSAYWRGILSKGDFLGSSLTYTAIRVPMLRMGHRLIAYNITGRSQAPEKVTSIDLFYLQGMDVKLVNIPYLLARYLRRFALGRKHGVMIFGGQFVARLAEHFGLLTK
nr:hypothetical protein [Tanacetum cinerariifolium]